MSEGTALHGPYPGALTNTAGPQESWGASVNRTEPVNLPAVPLTGALHFNSTNFHMAPPGRRKYVTTHAVQMKLGRVRTVSKIHGKPPGGEH